MRRRITLQNFLLFSSCFLLIFILAVYVNFRINAFILKVGDGVVSGIERSFNVRASYEQVYLSGIDSLRLKNVVIRRSDFHDPAVLLEVRDLTVKFNFFKFIFTSHIEEECLLALDAAGVVYNHFPKRPPPDGVRLQPVVVRKSSGPPLVFRNLRFDVRITDGWARLYSGPWQEERRQNPLMQVQIQRGLFRIADGRIETDLKSSTGLVERGFFSTRLDVKGGLDFGRRTGDLLFTFHDSIFAGAGIQDFSFLVSLQGEEWTLDSRLFRQPLSFNGKYREDGSGFLNLGFTRDSKLLFAFLQRHLPGNLDVMFIRPGERYFPEGEFSFNFDKDSFRLQGALALLDTRGNRVLDFTCLGNETALQIRRLRLANLARLIEFQGSWNYSDDLPLLQGVLRNVSVGEYLVSGSVSIDRPGAGRYLLRVGGLSVNGAPLGSLGTWLSIDKDAVRLDTAGINQPLQLSGEVQDDRNMRFAVRLGGYNVGALLRAFGMTPFWEERTLSATGDVLVEDGVFSSRGTLFAGELRDPKKRLELVYHYDGNLLTLDRLRLEDLEMTLSGALKFGSKEIELRFQLDHRGTRFHGYGSIKDEDGRQLVTVGIPGKLALSGQLGEGGVALNYRLTAFPLDGFGLEAALSGNGSLALRHGIPYAEGVLQAEGKGFARYLLKGVSAAYRLTGREFDISRLTLDGVRHRMEGSGSVTFRDSGVQGVFSIGNTLSAYLNVESGEVDGRIMLRGYRILGLLGEELTGILDGDILFSGKPEMPALSCNISLRRGTLAGMPFSGSLRSTQVPQGIRISGGTVRLGALRVRLGQGSVVQSLPGIFALGLDAEVRYAAGAADLLARFRASGSYESGLVDLQLFTDLLQVNRQMLGPLQSRVQFGKGRINIVRRSPGGVSGFYDFAQSAFSFRLFADNVQILDAAGEAGGEGVDYYLKSDNWPLASLKLVPGLASAASGAGQFQVHVSGPRDDVSLQGFFKATGGSLAINPLREAVQGLELDVRFAEHKIQVHTLRGTTGGETFDVDGFCFLRRNRPEDLNFRFHTGTKGGIPVNLDVSGIKLRGKFYADLFLRGDPDGPTLQGRVAIRDADVNYLGSSSSSGSSAKSPEGFADRIHWHVDFTALDRVSYINPLVTVVLQPQSRIGFRNRMADSNFHINGRITAAHGALDYLSHQFKIESPTYLEFRKVTGGYAPWLTFKGSTAMRDDDQEQVTVYITYDGILSGDFKPSFHTEPMKTQTEVMALLGVQSSTPDADPAKTKQNVLSKSTDLLASIGLAPLSRMVRKGVGLDFFTIRTSVVRYFLERESLDSLDPKRQLNILRDTQFTFGKYLTSFLFLEYTLSLKEDPGIRGDLVPAHQVGLELSFSPFNLGYSLRQTEKSGYSDFEQNFEIRFRKRF